MDVFVTEGNVEIYLSRLHTTWNALGRDKLRRLVCEDQARMGFSREHIKREKDGPAKAGNVSRSSVSWSRNSTLQDQNASHVALLLETLVKTRMLLKQQLSRLRKVQRVRRL